MKKKSKIRVLKDKPMDASYTFVVDLDLSSDGNLQRPLNSKEAEDNTESTDVDNLNEIYKKKKVLTNEDLRKASKGLKFNNPSQRNHSSVYE